MTNRQAQNTLRLLENRLLDNENVTINQNMLMTISTAINALGAIKQYKWELDIAISQLEDLGFQFGQNTEGYVCLTKEKYEDLLGYKEMYEDLFKETRC